ncbi:MAG: hypothetical protein IKV00_03090, partial [Clostridia bacterium]|nr:hypothetical protein [Clostridia bacterium]
VCRCGIFCRRGDATLLRKSGIARNERCAPVKWRKSFVFGRFVNRPYGVSADSKPTDKSKFEKENYRK